MAINTEQIGTNFFDEKFKNAIRDYYTYGFNEKTGTSKEREIWNRLNTILVQDMKWADEDSKIMFTTTDSQSNAENPFHRVYRFCLYNDEYLTYFFQILFALAPSAPLTNGVDSLQIKLKGNHKQDKIEELNAHLHGKIRLKTRELSYFYPNTDESDYATVRRHLNQLEVMGFLRSKDGSWQLSPITMSSVFEHGRNADHHFEEHFINTLDFYSKYFPLGEAGIYLLDRINHESGSPFRFKHEYYMQSLNDYNLIDLLYAIENNYCCRIKYSTGLSNLKSELLCYPIEIRISTLQGREYLAYYEPFSRNYSFLRLEFIDDIKFYKDEDIKRVALLSAKTISADLKNVRDSLKYSWGASTAHDPDGNATKKIKPDTVKMRISYDPDTEDYIKERLEREKRQGSINLSESKGYIDFEVQVVDTRELLPWIRSLYGRIYSISGIDNENFSIKDDLRKIYERLNGKLLEQIPSKHQRPQNWTMDDSQKNDLPPKGKIIPPSNKGYLYPHWQLFNEIFSVYYHIAADALIQIFHVGANKRAMSTEEVDDCIKKAFSKYKNISGIDTSRNLRSKLKSLLNETEKSGRFQTKCYVPPCNTMKIFSKNTSSTNSEYQLDHYSEKRVSEDDKEALLPLYSVDNNQDFYMDILPLSNLEKRWLLTILDDNKIQYFLSEKEISAVRDVLNSSESEKLESFPVNKINHFDQFIRPQNQNDKEQEVCSQLLKAIRRHRVVKIGQEKYKPIFMEYSKRDDRFRCYFQSCKDNTIFLKNLFKIYSLEVLDENFDYETAKKALDAYREKNSKHVTIQFTDERNVPDRILTEFSPWQKECKYDPDENVYTLTIYYQKDDEKEITIRFMGYGSDIYFLDRENPICQEIKKRIEKQNLLFQ